jgi:phosphoglycerate dehydrogenase-like enzyme
MNVLLTPHLGAQRADVQQALIDWAIETAQACSLHS